MRFFAKYCLILATFFPLVLAEAQNRLEIIEAFENGVSFTSFENEDFEPSAWQLTGENVAEGNYSLKLYGNTWKCEEIDAKEIDTATVWRISVYVDETAEIQGFGVGDENNFLFYSFYGSEEVEFENWVTVYQGAFALNNWNEIYLPLGEDWLSEFGYLPQLTKIVFVNDKDETPYGRVYFDEILDVSNTLNKPPRISISHSKGATIYDAGTKTVEVNFFSEVYDPDSDEWQYLWDFGDGETSVLPNPTHTFTVTDDHAFTVLLQVFDDADNYASVSCKINVDEGESSLPLTINFVGDIMLARGMEYIIEFEGMESIFEPTLSVFGEDADVSVANLECPLTNSETVHPTKPIFFKGKPEYVYGLLYAGIDAVTIANNHIYDYLEEGLTETVETLNENGIINFGAGVNSYFAKKPGFISKKGITLGFVGASDRTGQYNNYQPYLNAGFNKAGFANLTEYNISEQIENARASDLIIFQMHSGREYSTAPRKTEETPEDEFYDGNLSAPNKRDIQTRRYAIDEGADAVICHHPHIAQGFEVYKGKLIAHSLGNFVFDMGYSETFPSVILKGYANENGFFKYEIIPVYINDFIPRRARGELGLYWLDALSDMSRKLNAYVVVDRNSVKAEIILDSARIYFDKEQFENNVDFSWHGGYYYSEPLKIEKRGSVTKIISVGGSDEFEFRVGREKLWFGNMEDEGAEAWEFNHQDEFFDEAEAAFGMRSLCQKRPSGRLPLNTYLKKKMKIYNSEKSFTLHSYIKTQNGKNAGAQILIYDSRYSDYPLAVYELDNEVSGTTTWKEYFGDFEIPEYGKYYNIRLRSESPQTGVGESWFDNVGVIEWEDWQSGGESSGMDFPNDYYWVQIRKSVAANNESVIYEEAVWEDNPDNIESGETQLQQFTLYQNYPNPFNPTTTIKYSIPILNGVETHGRASLRIYNILGEEITTLVNKRQAPGNYEVQFDARDLPSGVYFYTLRIGERSITKKMVLLK